MLNSGEAVKGIYPAEDGLAKVHLIVSPKSLPNGNLQNHYPKPKYPTIGTLEPYGTGQKHLMVDV